MNVTESRLVGPGVQTMFREEKERLDMDTSKCPVCDWAITEGGIKITVGGREITVCCDDCAEKAMESPAKYATAAE